MSESPTPPANSDAPSDGRYTVIARRYRPQTFDELVGQEHVARALQQAISSGRVGHAYLFTGARGVGRVEFSTDGKTMYVADYGELYVNYQMESPFYTTPKSAVVWAITKQ